MKATTKFLAGFLFAMGASAAYKVAKSEQKQEELKNKLNHVQGQVQDMVEKATEAVSPYVEKAKVSYQESRDALTDSVSAQDEAAQPDIEIEEKDLDLQK
ncbi:hypothetical protein H7198_03645 [Fructobacillus sp. CRL 2054]|uniref:hypothetical protein n=1 Tax=Fructobacillus sp. CRL 2054 TaxID=2763007 RepID=UPI002378AA29|nr:hypothetical protein [Fructobacillus sp. CRL 2054]MDD9138695.1 hypothetical protein [Fructobacillus sp. CRL 2054]